MRKALAKEEGQRKKFTASFSRIGKRTNFKGHREETVLLLDVTDVETNHVVTDHAWFTFTKGFQQAAMNAGDRVEFEARIKKYNKGYVNRRYDINSTRTDYRLSNPTKIKVVAKPSIGI